MGNSQRLEILLNVCLILCLLVFVRTESVSLFDGRVEGDDPQVMRAVIDLPFYEEVEKTSVYNLILPAVFLFLFLSIHRIYRQAQRKSTTYFPPLMRFSADLLFLALSMGLFNMSISSLSLSSKLTGFHSHFAVWVIIIVIFIATIGFRSFDVQKYKQRVQLAFGIAFGLFVLLGYALYSWIPHTDASYAVMSSLTLGIFVYMNIYLVYAKESVLRNIPN